MSEQLPSLRHPPALRRRHKALLRGKKVATSLGPDEFQYLQAQAARYGYTNLGTYVRDKILDVPMDEEEIEPSAEG